MTSEASSLTPAYLCQTPAMLCVNGFSNVLVMLCIRCLVCHAVSKQSYLVRSTANANALVMLCVSCLVSVRNLLLKFLGPASCCA